MEPEEFTNTGGSGGGGGSSVCRKPNIASISRTSRHFVKSADVSTTETEDGDQSDSGVFNSSKTTGSMSDAELTDDGSEGRVGVLDYFQPRTDVKPAPSHNFGFIREPVQKSASITRLQYMNTIANDESFCLATSDEEDEFNGTLVTMLLDPVRPSTDNVLSGCMSPTAFAYEIPDDASLSPELYRAEQNLAVPIFSESSWPLADITSVVEKSRSFPPDCSASLSPYVSHDQSSNCNPKATLTSRQRKFDVSNNTDSSPCPKGNTYVGHGKQGIIHRNERLHDLAYDEAFENDSATDIDSPRSGGDDAYDSSELHQIVIETPQILPNPSPRGNPAVEIDEGTELKTFNVSSFNQHARKAHDEQYDEAVEVTSDDNDDVQIQSVHVHERLYGPHNSSGFASMDAEDDEEYEQEFSDKHAQAHRVLGDRTPFGSRYGNGGSIELPVKDRDFYHTGSSGPTGVGGGSLRRDVDTSVTFPLRYLDSSTPVRHYGTMPSSQDEYTVHRTSEGTYIKKDIMPKDPPFGNPLNTAKVERSVERLLDSSSRSAYNSKSSPPPSNMPVGEPIRSLEEGMGGVMSGEEKEKSTEQTTNNRKKKKKKKTKDEGTTDNKSYDVNGNPVDYSSREGDNRTLRTSESANKAMEHCGRLRPWPHTSYPAYFSCFDGYNTPNGPGKVGELEDAPSSNTSARNEQEQAFREKQQRRKQKKANEEAKVTRAENIPGNRGDQDVEKLLDFITGSNPKKGVKKKQVTGPAGVVQENGLPEKNNKSKKTLNGKAQSTCKSAEDKSSENSSEKGDDASSKLSDLGDEKVRDSDLVDNTKINDNGSEGSISSDLIKDITATAAKLDNNKHIKKSTKLEVDDTYSSGGEGPLNGSSVDIYPTSLVNDAYIFTDYDSVSLPVEEDFVTVSTKKKKVRNVGQPANNQHFHHKDNINGSGSHHYNSYRESSLSSMGDIRSSAGVGTQLAQLPSRGDDRRPSRPSRPMTRSVTPPPTSFSSSSQTDGSNDSNRRSYTKAGRDRAFSPSSIPTPSNKSEEESDFPIINTQSNDFPSLPTATKSHEGRRNSTGNVPSEVPDVDSDMESVKSLPLSSSNQRDGGSSPRGSGAANIISYARIAAGSRGGGKTMSMSNSTSTASVNSVPSSTVSNSAQNQAQQTADVTRQQDEGYATTDNTVDSSPSNNVSASSSKSEELSSLSGSESNTVKSESDKLIFQSPETPSENLTNAQLEAELVKSNHKDTDKTAAETETISSAISIGDESSSSGSNKTDNADVNKCNTVINDVVTNVASEDSTSSDVIATSGKSATATGRRTGKSKSSVVFLDKKMNKSPKDMEISFGFDEEMDSQGDDSGAPVEFGENVQGMQFGGSAMAYPHGGYVSSMPSVPPQDVCAMKGTMPGMNGVINPQEMMTYPPPHAIGIPVNMTRPPPAHMMMVPPPGAPTSGHVMMPPPAMAIPSPQYIPVPPTSIPPPQVVTSVPPPTPVVPVDSPVTFGAEAEPTEIDPNQTKDDEVEPSSTQLPTDVSNESDFPPLSAAAGKNVGTCATSTSAAVGEAPTETANADEIKRDNQCAEKDQQPEIEFLQPSLPEKAAEDEGSTDQQQQAEVEDGTLNLKKFWPSREHDPNFDCGNFVVEQAVVYLKKEWDRVLSKQKRSPEKVLVCSGV